MPEPQGEDFKKAVSVLLPYLLSHRTRLASLEGSSAGAEDSASAAAAGGFPSLPDSGAELSVGGEVKLGSQHT